MNRQDICGTIILYNPTAEIFGNIDSYIYAIDKLIVIDNSDIVNHDLINMLHEKYDNIIYKSNNENLGIAKALNIGCEVAIRNGYKWILTMDQDSSFVDIDYFLKCSKSQIYNKSDIAIITPNHSHKKQNISQSCSYEYKDIVITSGNLVNLDAYIKVDGYDNDLFIDMVDFDFSTKMNLNGFKIVYLKDIFILHSLGEVFQRRNLITRKVKEKIEHSAQRVYYITRNSLYLSSKYGKVFPKEYGLMKTLNILFIHEVTKILLYESHKMKKLYAKLFALYHYVTKRKGKYIL